MSNLLVMSMSVVLRLLCDLRIDCCVYVRNMAIMQHVCCK